MLKSGQPSFFCSCIQAVYKDSRLVENTQCLYACGAASTSSTACSRPCCSLSASAGKAVWCCQPPVQSRDVGSCVSKQQHGRLTQHGKAYNDMIKCLQLLRRRRLQALKLQIWPANKSDCSWQSLSNPAKFKRHSFVSN